MVARRGEPLQIGFAPTSLQEFPARYGFAVMEDLDLAELATRYPAHDGVRYTVGGWNRVVSATIDV